MRIEPRSIKNILVVRNDRFGEFLLNIPAIRALKETFSNANIIAAVNPYVKELAKSIPFIDEIIETKTFKHSFWEITGFIRLLRKKKIDIAVMLNPSKDFNIITKLSNIPIRVGYDRKWGFLLTHTVEDKKELGHKHEVEYNLELVNLIGAKTKNLNLYLDSGLDAIAGLNEYFNIINGRGEILALHPWTSDPVKQWPLENFRRLVIRLTEELNATVFIVGGHCEKQKSIECFSGLNARAVNFTGMTTLKQLAALFKKCKLLISGDSGPMHLACAVNTQVLAIFRNDIAGKSPKRWGPWGEKHIVVAKNKLSDISVDEVFDKAKGVLFR